MGANRERIVHNYTFDPYSYDSGSLHSVEVEELCEDGHWETVYQLGVNDDFWEAEKAATWICGLLGNIYRVMVYTNDHGEWVEEAQYAGRIG